MFDGQNIEDLPDYLQGHLIDGIGLDDLDVLEQFLDSNATTAEQRSKQQPIRSPRENQNFPTNEDENHDQQLVERDATDNTSKRDSPKVNNQESDQDKYGLPADIHYNFSRWLYGDLSSFAPENSVKKNPKDERTPLQKIRRKRKRRRLQMQQQQEAEEQLRLAQQRQQPDEEQSLEYNNDTTCNDLKFLTQDLELDEMQPIDEIVTPFLTIHHSILDSPKKVTFIGGHASNLITTNANIESSTTDYSKSNSAKLTITLRTTKTIIDRRPMFKKWKTLGKAPANNTDLTNEVTSTSLIAPGEDCDDSDDYEFEEVNGDEICLNR